MLAATSSSDLGCPGGRCISCHVQLPAVSMAGAARDGVIVVIVGGVSGGGKRKSKGLRIVVIIEVVRKRSLSLVFGRLEVDQN